MAATANRSDVESMSRITGETFGQTTDDDAFFGIEKCIVNILISANKK